MREASLIRTSLVLISFYWMRNCDGAVSVLNESHYSLEGHDTRINCSVTGEAFKGWFDSKGQKISNSPSRRLHVKNDGSLHYLEIKRVNRTDEGQYECRGETTKARVMLHVEYPPVLVRERSTTKTIYSSVDSNEEIAMNCVFDGSPVPLVRFQKFDVEINSSRITYGPGSASYKLIVRSADDFGFYTCVATNTRGRASHFIEVYNRGPPEPPNNIRVSANCDRIDVTWDPAVKDGGSRVLGYKIELWREGRTLKSESLPTSSRAKSFEDLESETLYEVRMNSKNAIGDGEWRIVHVNTTTTCVSQALSSASEFSFLFAWIISAHIIL